MRFGKLVVIERAPNKDGCHETFWRCRCDCGNEKVLCRGYLVSKGEKSCGCDLRERLREKSKGNKSRAGTGRKVVLVNETNGRTLFYNSALVASRDIGLTANNVYQVLNKTGTQITAGGYRWFWEDDMEWMKIRTEINMGIYTKSKQHYTKRYQLKGKKFGEWSVMDISNRRSTGGATYWICKCSCGRICEVLGASLVRGTSTNCGHKNNRVPKHPIHIIPDISIGNYFL